MNSFGHLYRFTTWGESHGKAIGVTIDGCPPKVDLTEKKIQNALSFLTKGKTTLVIAHRLSTILNSNKIYVIDNGKVVAEGDHTKLLNNSEIYKNFYNKQIQRN